ncbi:MAG: hypothetical protein ABII90_03050 [Bacteroidota bacterium]
MRFKKISIITLISNILICGFVFAQTSDPKLSVKIPAETLPCQPGNTVTREKAQSSKNKNSFINTPEAELIRAKEVYGNKSEIIKAKELKEKRQQNINKNNFQILPTDFPKYVNTGNPHDDQQNYSIAKEQWIQNNPEGYKELFNKNDSKVHVIPYEEFINIPAEKQKQIKNNPDKYKIVKP